MTQSLSIVGIDPGFASLGYAILVLGPKPRVVRFGVFKTQKTEKKQHVLSVEDNMRRAIDIARCLRDLITCCPRTVAIAAEAMSFPRSASVAAKVALTWGALAALSESTRIPILQGSPQQVKAATCGAKNVTKEAIQDAMLKLYPEIAKLRRGIAQGQWEHPHDALAVAHLMLQSHVVQMLRLAG